MKILTLALSCCAICASAWAQDLILPQVADGGGWQTTVVVTNTNANPASASLSFYMDNGDGTTQSWTPSFVEGGSTQGMTIPAGATQIFHTPGSASGATTGWGELTADTGVVGYAILSQTVAGQANQDEVAPASAAVSRVLVPFDNTGGASTAVSLVNTSSSPQTISVAFRTPDGTVTQNSLSNVAPHGHMSFPLSQQFPSTSGQSGLAEFYNSGGTFSLLALRTDSTGAVAASPVYTQTGSPILVTGGASGGSSGIAPPSFSSIVVTGTFSPAGQPTYQVRITIAALSPTVSLTTVTTVGVYVTPMYTASAFNAAFNSFTFDGQTFTFGGYSAGNGGAMEDSKLTMYGITSASLSLTLASGTVATTGNVTGNLSLASSLTTLSGPFTGTYIVNP